MSAFEMLPHIQEQYSMLVKNMDSAGSHMDLTLFQGIIVEENYINSIGFLTAKLLGSCDNKWVFIYKVLKIAPGRWSFLCKS